MTLPPASPKTTGTVLIVEGSAATRNRLRDQLGERHELTMAQTLGVARARAEESPPAAAVVTADEATAAELDLVAWLAHHHVPVLAVIADDFQRRKLLGAGASLALVRPPLEDEVATKRHEARIAAWLDAVTRGPAQFDRLSERPTLHSMLPTRSSGRRSQGPHTLRSEPMRSWHSRLPTAHPQTARPSALPMPRARALDLGASGLVVCIGISTGGPEALETLFRALPATMPPIVIVQHMPAGFTAALARRLDNASAMSVREARDDDTLYDGLALVAPGGVHLRLRRQGFHVVTELFDAPPVDRHRPSVNVLFESAADVVGALGIGVIMTGMGDDGTRGLLAMKARGALTVAQDANGCTVFGMPQRAIAAGAASQVVTLDDLATRLIEWTRAREALQRS